MTISWEAAAASHVGRARRTNEDAFRIDEQLGIFIVADGMGGHAAGEVASRLAVDSVTQALGSRPISGPGEAAERLREAFREAHRALSSCCKSDPATAGMGTTLVATVVTPGGALYAAHIGDSRLYQLSGGVLRQLTRDHSWVQREVDAGRLAVDAARSHHLAHVLTRVLTPDEPADPDFLDTTLHPGDLLLLCSDGLYNMVDGPTILDLLLEDAPLVARVENLIVTANQRGGADNITAVVVGIGRG